MKKMPTLHAEPIRCADGSSQGGLASNIQTAPLKPLVQALLTDFIAARRVPVGKDEVKS